MVGAVADLHRPLEPCKTAHDARHAAVFEREVRIDCPDQRADLAGGEKARRAATDEHRVDLPTFGVGKEFSKGEWRGLFRQLIARGLLAVDLEAHGGLRLTEMGFHRLKSGAVRDRLGRWLRELRRIAWWGLGLGVVFNLVFLLPRALAESPSMASGLVSTIGFFKPRSSVCTW